MDYVKVVHSKLSLEEISELASSPSCGAISIFMGTTRDTFENKQVVQLEYEAYEPMAVKAMQKVCDDIREKWQVENIAIYHRLGIVPVKEASVIIAVSSPHRTESLQAVQFAIDTLKSSIPIWKKEVYATKEAEWKENKECAWKTPLDTREKETKEGKEVAECKDDIDNVVLDVSSDLVQIKASADEIKRRINSFIERKREQVNLGNIQDFCYHGEESASENSCARVDALLIRRKDSKSHLRVRRVLNTWGPQTRGLDPGSMGTVNPQDPAKSLIHGSTSEPKERQEPVCLQGISERLLNAESHLRLQGPVPPDVYSRLKRIEDRILFLEGVSPEYFSFWDDVLHQNDISRSPQKKKRTYSNAEIEQKIQELQYKLALKQKQP